MSSETEVLARLEKRALQADTIIALLTKQIGQLQGQQGSSSKQALIEENKKLRCEVDSLKTQLVNLEQENGVKQYYDFSKKLSNGTVPQNVSSKSSPPPSAEAPVSAPTTEKKEKPKKEKKSGGGGKKPEVPEAPADVARLDFRVGRIVSAKKHPDADSLYVEEVDVGEGKMRTVVSGLVKFIPEEEMQNRMAVLLCNLKPAKMRGVVSEAMVMCASTPDKVEILTPPAGCEPGDLVEFEGYTRNPDAVLNPKKKVFETCAPELKTNDTKVACYKGIPFTVPGKGIVVSQTLANVQVK